MPCYRFAFMSELKKEKDKGRKRVHIIGFILCKYILPSLPNQYFDFWFDSDRIQNIDLFISKSK